ncbi:MAG: hypothetical protein IJ371_00105 [Clostridia bacterium]|nr:hypothetical protein [Clostridia bacterium]
MWDRIVNFVYEIIRSWSHTTFIIVVAVMLTLGFYFVGNFLKANKKEAPKVAKPSQILLAILMLVLFVALINIRY